MRDKNAAYGEDERKIEAVLTERASTLSELQQATSLSKAQVVVALGISTYETLPGLRKKEIVKKFGSSCPQNSGSE
jgi:hypothetical protein